jgi:chromosome partitioning protein
MRTYATYNVKGGVGKTSTAVNLAYLSAAEGRPTLLWDLDPQGAATYLLRVRPRVRGGAKILIHGRRGLDGAIKGSDFDNLDLLPADFRYRSMDLQLASARRPADRLAQVLADLSDEYAVAFLDCPPSMSLVSENVLHAADMLLVPLIPTILSLRTLDQLTDFVAGFGGRRPEVMAFFSMVDRRKKLHRDIVARLPEQSACVSTFAIPALSLIEQMAEHRAPVPVFAPRSEASRLYRELWERIRPQA